MTQIFSMKPSEFEISLSVETYDENTAESFQNFYDAEKRIVSTLSELSIPNLNSTVFKLESNCVTI